MATYIKNDRITGNLKIYNTSDWHVGSKCFHESAAVDLVDRVKKEDAFLTFGGDALEGKMIDSPHFNPDGLNHGQLDIHSQADAFVQIMEPIADRILMLQGGNHELYLKKNFDVVRYICKCLGRPDVYGQYQTWLNVAGVTMHFWHGRPSMPRGAKDPIQREANQRAWLKNKMAPLAGSAHAQYMGHTHQCMVVEPIEQYALLDSGDNVHGEYFTEQLRNINGKAWMPPDARWYVNTGTLRRGGGFDHEDYSEIAGYTPPPIACTKTVIKDGSIKKIKKVML
jgi:hypothetical protein